MKIAEFDGATIAPENGAAARGEAMAALAGEHHELLTSDDAVALVSELEQGVAAGEISDPKLVAQIRHARARSARGPRLPHRGSRSVEPPHL